MYLENDRLQTKGLCRLCRDGDARETVAGEASNAPPAGCKEKEPAHRWGLRGYPLAAVYAPLQEFEGLYDPATALSRGTLFEALDLPFEGKSITKGGCGCG